MTTLFEQDNRKPKLMGNHRHHATAEAAADNGKIKLAFQLAPPQRVHEILSSTTCRRFIWRRRATRSAWQCTHDSRRSHRSAKTLPALSRKPYSMADSRVAKDGGSNMSASIAPFPARVGIRVTAVAPASIANAKERSAHWSASAAGMSGGCTRIKTRRSIPL